MSSQEWEIWLAHVELVADHLTTLAHGNLVEVPAISPAPSKLAPPELVPMIAAAQARLEHAVAVAEERFRSLQLSDQFVRQLPEAAPAPSTRQL